MSLKAGKVWGETEVIVKNPIVELHRISVKAGYRCSLHSHSHKWNGFYVESGILEIHVQKKDYALTDVTVLKAGEHTTVQPGELHFFSCKEDCIAFEIYYPELLTEDIHRISVGKKE
jgi:mannose-6-phosphate isomerase-like protein (cupin superfamily)